VNTTPTTPDVSDSRARLELMPTGKLRDGVVRAPVAGVFFVRVDDGGRPRGITVDLFEALAEVLGTETIFSVFPNSGECTDTLASGGIDVAFMPVDEERRRKVKFGPAYYLLRSTFLIAGEQGIRTAAEYQARGRRFVGITGTTTLRAAARAYGAERAFEARGVDEALTAFANGEADAVALSEDYLRMVQPRFPGSIVMEEAFQQTGIAIAVSNQRPAALELASDFLEHARKSGLVRQVFDRHGLTEEALAPGRAQAADRKEKRP